MLAGQAVMINWSNVAEAHRCAYYHWHGHEHMIGRLAIAGYRRGRRLKAVNANRDFLVLYEVDDLAVVTGKDYLDKANNPSSLTKATTQYVKDSARALARVRLSLGIGLGGFMLTLRFDAMPRHEPELDGFVCDALSRAAQVTGIVGAHFCLADPAASRIVPVERQGRPTTVPAWIVLLEGIDLEILERFADENLSARALVEHGAKEPIERDTYVMQLAVGT